VNTLGTPRAGTAPEASGNPQSQKQYATLRTLAVILGAPLLALLVSAFLVAYLPLSKPLAFAVGMHGLVPLWVTLACLLPLARNGLVAWAFCLAAGLPLGLLLIVR
jgi:hypothetical protein